MMISALQAIANQLTTPDQVVTFLFGEKEAFNIKADDLPPDYVVIYHQGYISGKVVEDAQGAFETTYNLTLLILTPSSFSDNPEGRLQGFLRVESVLQNLLRALTKDFEISNITHTEGINLTDRNLDGIRVTLNAISLVTTGKSC